MSTNNFSVIIATLNRTDDLLITLKSICSSSIRPKRIIIVDDGDIESTKSSINYMIKLNSNIHFVIIPGDSTGLANARNIGVNYINDSEIVFFLDDDVTLNEDYFKIIINTFKINSEIIGCQGFISNTISQNVLLRIIIGLTGILIPIKRSFFRPDVTRLMVHRYPLFIPKFKKIRYCDWLSGCNMSYRADLLNKFKFDEKLIQYSLGEDFDYSYSLKKKGYKLAINFEALLIHRCSNEFRIQKKSLLLMDFGYHFYLIHKHCSNQIIAYYLCVYHAFSIFFTYLLFSSLNLCSKGNLKEYIEAYRSVKMLEKDIASGDLSRLNSRIKSLKNT